MSSRTTQSQKTQGFRVADFAMLSDERWLRLKIFLLFNMDKRTFCSKDLKGSHVRKVLGFCKLHCYFLDEKTNTVKK